MRAVHTDCLEAHRARSEQAVNGSLDLRGLCCETELAAHVEIFPYFYLHNSLLGKELLATSIAIKYLNLLYIRLSSQFTFTFREFFCICQSLQPGPRNTNTAESLSLPKTDQSACACVNLIFQLRISINVSAFYLFENVKMMTTLCPENYKDRSCVPQG